MTPSVHGLILIVEDEPAISEMVATALRREGFETIQAPDATIAQERLTERIPDLILLDWMLPGVPGLELARRLRREELTEEIPIIMLTAKGDEDDRVRGLNVGADDYLVKPFSTRELVARIKAVLRRVRPQGEDSTIMVDGLVVDTAAQRVFAGENPLRMGPMEYRLLCFFVQHQERVYSRSQLLDRVWGSGVYVEERTVDVHIRRLRKALSPHSFDRFIQTVRGSGYRFSTRV